jgi:CxxC motif-containing protein (DUF1111 family)
VRSAWWAGAVLWGSAVLGAGPFAVAVRAGDSATGSREERVSGRELFEREWLPGDSRAHGGDGLGPVYNDSSCIACHNLGGGGGGGAASKNVDLITASANSLVPQADGQPQRGKPGFLAKSLASLVGLEATDDSPRKPAQTKSAPRPPVRRKPNTTELVKVHPGFRTARSVVLHRFGTEPGYEGWRQGMLGFGGFASQGNEPTGIGLVLAQNAVNMGRQATQNFVGEFALVRSQRNPTALFGAGLIDAIPERAIEEASRAQHPAFPEIAGRVSRLKDKRIGRFGWKGQTASLSDFVLTACAVELGLEVPGHHQGGIPQKPETKAKGLDLTGQECDALVDYVRTLPRPAERKPASPVESQELASGSALFTSIGCASCHTPKLGQAEGIYSDLLLHDLGPQLGDTGQYGVFDPSSSEEGLQDDALPITDAASPAPAILAEQVVVGPAPPLPVAPSASTSVVQETSVPFATPTAFPGGPVRLARPTTGPASRFEWRTPPLWGFRDSGPYLHDGRAETLDQAVALHGGEAMRIARNFFHLKPEKRRQVEAFLKSLTAPDPTPAERVASAR